MKYLPINVYRNDMSDSTNNGISSINSNKLAVAHASGFLSEQDIVNGEYIVLELEIKKIGKDEYKCLKQRGDNRWLMFGGNFAYTSDSRFNDYSRQPIAIHDRYEN